MFEKHLLTMTCVFFYCMKTNCLFRLMIFNYITFNGQSGYFLLSKLLIFLLLILETNIPFYYYLQYFFKYTYL